jgi:hypothetical protein
MAKTLPPGTIKVPNVATPFSANAVPDPFDERDLEYRPRLEPLPPLLDQRDPDTQFVLLQKGNSCTGHAVASVINTVLARAVLGPQPLNGGIERPKPAPIYVSPYMLYRLGRRYDEFAGEDDIGSSLRGVFKGWFHHGVALNDDWPDLELPREPDLDNPDFVARCRERPLGAFYRVNPYRLDDMQSAINELRAIAVSSAIHDGWRTPEPLTNAASGQTIYLIRRDVNSKSLGGHAYAIVGYNQIGFLVQNSWGPRWGNDGFATLPYEDWLDSAYDAWVARPGVPKTPFATGRTRTAKATGGEFVTAPGPDLKRLAVHVVNLGNEGRLSTSGKFISTPAQIDKIFARMEDWHDAWLRAGLAQKRHIVLYAHGGLVSEADGLATAQKHLNWWFNNGIYPVSFAWQSGPTETFLDQLVDMIKGKLPAGGLGFDLMEQFDRFVELTARSNFRWVWDQMKQNARAASERIDRPDQIAWPPDSTAAQQAMAKMPGGTLTVNRLAAYIKKHGAEKVAVHLVGHSAGSIFHAALLGRLLDAGIAVETMALLAPAIRVDEFEQTILPHLGKSVKRFATFALSDQRELDDVCGLSGMNIYNKSLLFLVARALERPASSKTFEVPILGMQRFFDQPLDGGRTTLRAAIEAAGGAAIFSRSAAPDDGRSDAVGHSDFDDDSPTMTSVVLRILDSPTPTRENDYQANTALLRTDQPGTALQSATPAPAAAQPITPAAETHAPGSTPLVDTAKPQRGRPVAPQKPFDLEPEVAVAPRSGSPIVDVLMDVGWAPTQKNGKPSRLAPKKRSKTPKKAKA